MRAILIAAPLFAMAGAVLAQDAAALQNLDACRSGINSVDIRFSYTGGACEAADPATVTIDNGVAKVSVPTHATAEMCTMQALEIQVAQTVAISADAGSVEVELLNIQGAPAGNGKVDIAAQCTEG